MESDPDGTWVDAECLRNLLRVHLNPVGEDEGFAKRFRQGIESLPHIALDRNICGIRPCHPTEDPQSGFASRLAQSPPREVERQAI